MLGHDDPLSHRHHHHSLLDPIDQGLPPFKQWKKMDEGAKHCHKPTCGWTSLDNLSGLRDVPRLRPDPELSGIGVLLGFSITAYLTLALLILHYLTVHDYHRTNANGKKYTNLVDRAVLSVIRERILSWRPSRRFEYAMEKAVLILSDTQLVTGLAFLIGGYSQLNCGISAYHWQIMIYVAWFSSFSFLSSMTFLEGYFQTNHSLRIIRVCFMVILGSLLIVALIPTGSHNWLNLLPGEGGFYPSLETECFFQQIRRGTFNYHGSPKIWSMVISILVIAISYIHSGIRLFDPTAHFTRKNLRARPGAYIKHVLHNLQAKATPRGIRASLWTVPYLTVFAAFTSLRALFDIMESMLLEIFWFGFAISWGSIKLWDTRALTAFDVNGENVNAHAEVLEEDSWSFGQILPLVLLLLPIFAMVQTYLDNDAKLADAACRAALAEKITDERYASAAQPQQVVLVQVPDEHKSNNEPEFGSRNSDSCSVKGSNHQSSKCRTRGCSSATYRASSATTESPNETNHTSSGYTSSLPQLPQDLSLSFAGYPWYTDHIILLIAQIFMITVFLLYLLTRIASVLGLSVFIRHRLFLEWVFAIIPAASLLHLGVWYAAAWAMKASGIEAWFVDTKLIADLEARRSKKVYAARGLVLLLRTALVAGLLVFTFVMSIEIAGPDGFTN